MKLPATIVSLFIATSLPLSATAAIATPLSASSSSLRQAGAAAVEYVQHRQSRTSRHHSVTRAERDNAYGAYSYSPGHGIDDWSHWSPSHHPGWPCVSGDASETSAYPSWEVGPGCR
jgi:hypothetical protein